jgi:Flp pilus assembly protein CpaB
VLGRSPRAVLLRAGAVVVAVFTAGLVASDLAKLHRNANDLGAPRGAVIATRDLTLGVAVRADDLRVRKVHASQLPPGVLSSIGNVVGRVVTVPVLRGDFVSTRHLAPRRRTGVDGAIPPGMRAVRILVSGTIRPRAGAAVDVLATFEAGSSFTSAGELDLQDTGTLDDGSNAAIVIADGVLVLGTDNAATADGGVAVGVTLLVTPRQARELAFAATHGVLSLSLVPPEDANSG